MLVFSHGAWLWAGAAALLLIALVLLWSYHPLSKDLTAWFAISWKICGLAILIFFLLDPHWAGQRARPGANLFAIVADNSMGLQIKDSNDVRTRGEQLRELLASPAATWEAELSQNFDLRRYVFDTRLQTSRDFQELRFDGQATALGKSLRTLADRYRGRPLAGVMVFTDGNATDIPQGQLDTTGLPPLYPVVIGRPEPIRDLAIQQVHVSQSAFEEAPVSLQADVLASGFDGESIRVRLLDAAGKLVSEQTGRPRRESELIPFRFQTRPAKGGLQLYQVEVSALYPEAAGKGRGESGEATLLNNTRLAIVQREQGPYRILYVAGRPNWEYKFLNRALQADPEMQLVALIRVAQREPKFEFRGRLGETGNPLFRGFGTQSREEVERYDQPVVIRLNTRDEEELRQGFPTTPEELYAYHAVVLDDVEAGFFTPDQAQLLGKFVSERGGGLLMLGGMESFHQGQYRRTPIGDLLPIYLNESAKPPGPIRLNLTREGSLLSWARLRQEEAEEKRLRDHLPAFQVLNPVREIKPGASLVATANDASGQSYPALVVQRIGQGRSAALLVGDLWRWGLRNEESRRDLDQTWRQLMRWLVTDVPKPVELTVESLNDDFPGARHILARIRDAKFQPVDDATVSLEIQHVPAVSQPPNASNRIRIPFESSLEESGLFQAMYAPRANGAFHAYARATNASGGEIGRAEVGWTTDLLADEFRTTTPNLALLEALARQTGGKVIPSSQLNDFVRNLPKRHAPIQESWSYPLWHTPALFALALLCFVAEWGLRRWKGWP
jgi:uncharacterized membrane protein